MAFLNGEKPLSAITLTKIDARVYLRTAATDNEALICICAPDADLVEVVAQGASTLGHIMAMS